MYYVKAIATKLIDDTRYPEIILCEFFDYDGHKHEFIEKWPVVSDKEFKNVFPRECVIGCTILETKRDSYIVSTLKPWDIESVEEINVFEISKNLLLEI